MVCLIPRILIESNKNFFFSKLYCFQVKRQKRNFLNNITWNTICKDLFSYCIFRYILLKERNMLLTMEHNYKEEVLSMPNQERIDKVEESMDNLETVVRERNRAFYELETGESGERERIIRSGPFGIDVGYVKQEHTLPRKYNIPYRKMLRYRYHTSWGPEVREFHARYLELRRKEEWNERMTQMRKVSWILKRFPDTDESAIKEKYPMADINAVKRWYKIKGHHSNQQFNV